MSKLDELIQQLCPDGVEWTKISDICLNICSGGTPSTSHEEYYHGNIPWLRTQEVDWKEINDTEIKITDDAITNSSAKIIPANCVIVAMYGATAAKAAINKIPLSTNQACCNLEIDSNKALYRYVYQWFCKEYDKLKAMGEGSQNNINGKKVKDYPIPLPPLPVQEEIVRLLDQLTETTEKYQAELEAELNARKKQYEEYRNQLFSFDEFKLKVKLLKIEDIAKCYAGATPKTERKEYWDNGNIPWMSSGEVNLGQVYHTEKFITQEGYDNSSTKMLPKDTVVIALAGQGKTRGTVAITRIELCTNQSLCGIVLNNNEVNSDYLYYYLKGQYETLRKISSGDGTRGGLNLKMINNFEVPIPDLLEQERIVNILNRMDKTHKELCQSIETEIKMRKQQYEYYRNQLLDFKKKEE